MLEKSKKYLKGMEIKINFENLGFYEDDAGPFEVLCSSGTFDPNMWNHADADQENKIFIMYDNKRKINAKVKLLNTSYKNKWVKVLLLEDAYKDESEDFHFNG